MWFEVLPPLTIITVALSIPQFSAYYLAKWFEGKPIRRRFIEQWDGLMFSRDIRVAGSHLKTQGLEAIPDK